MLVLVLLLLWLWRSSLPPRERVIVGVIMGYWSKRLGACLLFFILAAAATSSLLLVLVIVLPVLRKAFRS